jgi:transcription elongation GreA/GreB family factor
MNSLKEKVHNKCVEMVNQTVIMHQKAMNDAQDAANKEQRSTAGDKYDTSRAMSQNERDMYAGRLADSLQMKKVLNNIDPNKNLDHAESGSLVITEHINYYLSVSLGKLSFDGLECFAISPMTPAGQAMLGKCAGDTFEIRGQANQIKKIW